MSRAPSTELKSFLSRHAEKLRGGLIEGRRRWFETLLRLAPRVTALVEAKLYRELGWASYLDCMSQFGLSGKDAAELLAVGRAMPHAPALLEDVRQGRVELEKLFVVAPLVPEQGEARVRKLVQRLDLKGLRRHVRQANLGPRTMEDGREVWPLLLRLSADARTMAGDLRARLSQVRERVVPWHEVYGTAVRTAMRRLERGAAAGERQYRVVVLDGTDGVRPVLCEGELVDVERKGWELVRTRAVETAEDVVLRFARKRFRLRRSDGGRHERRELAERLGRELKRALDESGNWHYQAARALALIEEWGLDREMGYRGMGEMARALLGIAPSTTSELMACGRVCREFGQIRTLFREGKLEWTKLRALAPYITQDNLGAMVAAMRLMNAKRVRRMAQALKNGGRAPRGRGRRERPSTRVEMDEYDWFEFNRLQDLLSEQAGRKVSEAEVLEEALWQACRSYGAPRPLWGTYRILVYLRDGVHWQNGITGPIQCDAPEGAVRVTVVAEELAEAVRLEEERLARQAPERRMLGGLKPPPWAPDVEGFWLLHLPPWLRAPEPPGRVKRAVLLAAGGCCGVPGCSSRLFLHAHHIVQRQSGGGNHPDNLYCVCSSCHGKLHEAGWALVRLAARDTGSAVSVAAGHASGGVAGRKAAGAMDRRPTVIGIGRC